MWGCDFYNVGVGSGEIPPQISYPYARPCMTFIRVSKRKTHSKKSSVSDPHPNDADPDPDPWIRI